MSQSFDTLKFSIRTEFSAETNQFFTNDMFWRGADGGSSVDLGKGRVLWLFSDGFICRNASGLRNKSKMIRNSVAIQQGYDLKTATLKYYWRGTHKKPEPFFKSPPEYWFWTQHGIMIKDKLLIFLMKEHGIKDKLGFEAFGWSVVLVSNPQDEPSAWKMEFIDGCETFGVIAGSSLLKDSNYIYSYGSVEPDTHEGYLFRWKIEDAYAGNFSKPEWWMNGNWMLRNSKDPIPKPLLKDADFSVHYDSILKKYIQIQSFGFGEGKIGMRMADSLNGNWTEPILFYTPQYPGVKKPFMYSAKSHPEITGDGIYITYNVNSFDFGELIENQSIYFPRFVRVQILRKQEVH